MVYKNNYPPWIEHDDRVYQSKKLSDVSLRLLRPYVPENATSPPSTSPRSPPDWNPHRQNNVGSFDDDEPMMDYANCRLSSANILASIRRPSKSTDTIPSPQFWETTATSNWSFERSETRYSPQTVTRDSADGGGHGTVSPTISSSSAAVILQTLRRPGTTISGTPSPKPDETTPTWPATDEKSSNGTQNRLSLAGLKPADRIRRIREALPAQEPPKNVEIADEAVHQFRKSSAESSDFSHHLFSPYFEIPRQPLRRPHRY